MPAKISEKKSKHTVDFSFELVTLIVIWVSNKKNLKNNYGHCLNGPYSDRHLHQTFQAIVSRGELVPLYYVQVIRIVELYQTRAQYKSAC